MGRSLSTLRRLRSVAQRTLLAILAVLLSGVAGVMIWKCIDDGKLLSLYPEHALLEQPNAEVLSRSVDPVTGFGTITISDWEGRTLSARVVIPREPPPPEGYGCVIVNYGIGQTMNFSQRLAPFFAGRGVILVMPEQYGRGVRRIEGEQSLFQRAYEPRERAARLVAETRMWVDYLEEQPDVDKSRIDYMGISYGGIVGATLVANEPRFRTATFVMAGGDLTPMLKGLLSHIYPASPMLNTTLASIGAWWLSAFEPLDYIGVAQTQKMLFLTVEPDELIPSASSHALIQAATVPSTTRTYPGPHSRAPADSVRRMISDALDWMGYPIQPSVSSKNGPVR